jgi:hypothetical protein
MEGDFHYLILINNIYANLKKPNHTCGWFELKQQIANN